MIRNLLIWCASALLCSAAHAGSIYTEYLGPRTAKLGSSLVATFCRRVANDCGLWVTDGTAGGTREIKQMRNPGFSSDLRYLVSAEDRVYIVGYSSADLSHTLFMTDGTPSGTVTVPGGGYPYTLSRPAAIGKQLVFVQYGLKEIWRTDGSAAGTFKVGDLELGSANRIDLVGAGGYVYYTNSDAAHGYELWKTDGTIAGTGMVADLIPGSGSGSAGYITAVGDKIFFLSSDGAGGLRFTVSDGTSAGTVQLANVTNGYPQIVASGSIAYLFLQTTASTTSIWRSDGTVSGTALVGEFPLTLVRDSPSSYAALGAHVYFKVQDNPNQLWRTDGTFAGTGPVAPSTALGIVRELVAAQDAVFFTAGPSSIWKTQGTDATTLNVGPTGDVHPFASIGNTLLFYNDYAVWTNDGTVGGSQQLFSADDVLFPTLSFATATSSVAEAGTTTIQVQRTGSSHGAASVRWTTANGSAVAGTNYGAAGNTSQLSGVLSWADGDMTSRTLVIGGAGVDIPLIDDAVPRENQAFQVVLSNGSPGSDLGPIKSVDVTIADNDAGFVLSAAEYSVDESAATVSIVVKRLGALPRTSPAIQWTALNGTAVAGQDFGTRGNATAPSGTLTFSSTETSKTITIPILQDIASEGAETFTVVLSNPSTGMAVGVPGTATVTINDDDIPAESNVSFSQPKYLVMENDGNAVLTLHRAPVGGGFTASATVNYATVPGTALATSDYMARSGSVTWTGTDATDKTITIPIVNNAVAESHESFTVTITPSTAGVLVEAPEATVTIVDDDDAFPKFGVVPDGWIVPAGATAGWHASNDAGAYEGVFSLRSDAIDDNETSQIEVTRDFAAGNITFRAKVSSEAGFDVLRFFVDGVEKAAWSGTTATGWQLASIPITAGSHTVRWSYEKDGSASVGYDAAWIDAVTLP